MRVLTYAAAPRDINAVVALGAREVLTALPASPAAPSVVDFAAAAAAHSVRLWLVVPDVRGEPDLGSWSTEEGRAALQSKGFGVVCRSASAARRLRELAPALELMIGPWPEPARGIDAAILRELGVRRVWARAWSSLAELKERLAVAARAGTEVVLAMPTGARMRELEADGDVWRELGELLEDPRAIWAISVRAGADLEARCGELMEFRTVLATKPGYRSGTWTGPSDADDAAAYDQTEGFPLIYAELMRHPPSITAPEAEARTAMRLDAPVEWPHAPDGLTAYVHVPFCAKRCRFCFCSSNCYPGHGAELAAAFVDALCAEVDMWAGSRLLAGRELQTLYVGGGSPSALAPDQLARVIRHAQERLPFVRAAMVSVEMAPSSTTSAKLESARAAGVSRVSFGVQSFSERSLRTIGSAHSEALAVRAVENAHAAGFDDVDVDLIYGIPGQSAHELQSDIERAVSLGVASVMLFPLHVTPPLLAWWAETGVDCRAWTATRYREFWVTGDRVLTAHGYSRFGYSHYKRPLAVDRGATTASPYGGYSGYMYVLPGSDGQLALGPTAVGCIGRRQYENVCSVTEYVRRVRGGHLPVGAYAEPPSEEAALVWMLLEQATFPGTVSYADFERRFGQAARARIRTLLEPLRERNLFAATDGGYEMTREGVMWMANVQLEILRRAGLPAPRGHLIQD